MYQPNVDIDITIRENAHLVYGAFKKYFQGVNFDADLYQIGLIELWHSAIKFDSTKGYSFSTYAYPAIKNAILRELIKRNKRNVESSLEDCLYGLYDDDKENNWESYIGLDYYDDYSEIEFDGMCDSQKEVLKLIAQGYSKADVARICGVSKQAIHERIKKAKKWIEE